MKINLLILYAFGLASIVFTLPCLAQTEALKSYKSVETSIAGFSNAFCAELPDKLSVCKAVINRDESNEAKYLVRQNKKTLGEWKTEITMYSDVKDFRVLEGDLDGDGSPEILVPQLDGVSNGMGVRYYSIYVLPNPLKKGFRAPLMFQTQEFGANGTFAFNSPTKTFDILITYWTNGFELPGIAPKVKADATYFIGRWFRYRGGKLAPAFDKPVLARRYLNSFQNERDKEDLSEKFPHSWLQNSAVLQFNSDPEISQKTVSSLRGTLEKYERRELPIADEERTIVYEQFTIRLESGKTVSYVYAPQVDFDENLKSLKMPLVNRVGFLRKKLILPKQISVSDIFNLSGANRIENKKVTLTTFSSSKGGSDAQRILWFDEIK